MEDTEQKIQYPDHKNDVQTLIEQPVYKGAEIAPITGKAEKIHYLNTSFLLKIDLMK